jgi:SAM-dependent methyltransferase
LIVQGVEICCPVCKGDFQSPGDKDLLECESCGRSFPIIYGIPDLRVFEDPYLSIEQDRAKALELATHFDELDFQGLVKYYYHDKQDVPPPQIQQYVRGIMAGPARAQGALDSWEATSGDKRKKSDLTVLEVGCGTAPMLITAGRSYLKMIGVDIGLRWLIIGLKRLRESGMDIPLICACAEALPFHDDSFDGVIFDSVLENVRDQIQTMKECNRLTRIGGRIFISTPNRFSIGPDPHVGLLAGGFFPETWIAAYVRRKGGIPPKRQLLSSRSLHNLIANSGFSTINISIPDIPVDQRRFYQGVMGKMIELYHIVKRLPGGREILTTLGPVLHAVAEKKPNI